MAVRSLKNLPDIVHFVRFVRFVRFVLRGNEVRKVSINHFLITSNAYYTSIRTRKASPCTIFNKTKCLLWAKWIFFLPNSQKAFAFVEYGTRRCLSSSDRGVALEIEEISYVLYVSFSGEMKCGKCRSTTF